MPVMQQLTVRAADVSVAEAIEAVIRERFPTALVEWTSYPIVEDPQVVIERNREPADHPEPAERPDGHPDAIWEPESGRWLMPDPEGRLHRGQPTYVMVGPKEVEPAP
jgi:hypothetical protein